METEGVGTVQHLQIDVGGVVIADEAEAVSPYCHPDVCNPTIPGSWGGSQSSCPVKLWLVAGMARLTAIPESP
jgi:hypothetical protein